MSVSKEQVVEFLSKMTVMEMATLVKELEELWGVEAAPAVVAGAAPAAGAAAPAAAAVEEQTEFDVVIEDVGAKKIEVIKAIREITSLGLKEAKEMAENNQVVKTGVSKEEATSIQKKLEEAGAKVKVK
ncbi:50S ribosomal protein L7/L12 [Myxococcota bacterium]|nr:50S ribosomal protein L7/L12 [Myxococcota bacterium]MBU1411263.1 50S ribosomal protein L7/L12 [Myxococcota bacterium]MBU1509638.1 50S ribosomal protein L7/L12 [Myxococcota bacterium]PKN27438.1 MAG: 50S ribosomal protein L7/L12 [Deltaproteobacteria bacterium HGW-Deltaproteobacteria-22]